MKIPYFTFPKTYVKNSNIIGAGKGLFLDENITKYDWIGFYPGKIDKIGNIQPNEYTMGTLFNNIIINANPNILRGVHLINEGNYEYKINTFYVKLSNGLCLYFAGKNIKKNTELLTCYSNSYGKRNYNISNNCEDPRCVNSVNKHRNNSLKYNNWLHKLNIKCPKNINILLK